MAISLCSPTGFSMDNFFKLEIDHRFDVPALLSRAYPFVLHERDDLYLHQLLPSDTDRSNTSKLSMVVQWHCSNPKSSRDGTISGAMLCMLGFPIGCRWDEREQRGGRAMREPNQLFEQHEVQVLKPFCMTILCASMH
jgi:hypothetical protein